MGGKTAEGDLYQKVRLGSGKIVILHKCAVVFYYTSRFLRPSTGSVSAKRKDNKPVLNFPKDIKTVKQHF